MFRGGGSRHAFEPLQFPSKPLRPRRSPLEYHFNESRAKSLAKSFVVRPAAISGGELEPSSVRLAAQLFIRIWTETTPDN